MFPICFMTMSHTNRVTAIGLICCSACFLLVSCVFAPGGGGSEQYAPDKVKAGDPTVIRLIVIAWGAGGPIQGRFTNISLHYKLSSDISYKTIRPQISVVPANYTRVASNVKQFEAY